MDWNLILQPDVLNWKYRTQNSDPKFRFHLSSAVIFAVSTFQHEVKETNASKNILEMYIQAFHDKIKLYTKPKIYIN